MKNIYIETDENFRVTKIHRMPFDPNNGMGYTREELEKKGFFVEEIPESVHQTGKRSIAMYNPDTKSIYYEYVTTNLSDKERLENAEKFLNFLAMNAIYGTLGYSAQTMAVDYALLTDMEPKLSVYEEGAANYLASQIIAGKLELDKCLSAFPQFESAIKSTLKENGIQV